MRTTTQTVRIAAALGVLMFILGVFGPHLTLAQAPQAPPVGSRLQAPAALPPGSAPAIDVESSDPQPVHLLVGRSTLVDVGGPIARVSLTSADVADALVTSPTQLLVHGKVPGAISMFVWNRAGAVMRYEVSVQRDLARLNDQIAQLFPAERLEAQSTGRNIVLTGRVSTQDVADKVASVAAGYVENKNEVVSLLQVQPGPRSNQVLLRVRFAEVSRSALTEFGMSFFTSPTGIKNNVGRLTTQQYSAPNFSDLAWTKANNDWGSRVTSAEGKVDFSDFLNVFLLNQRYDLGVLIKALQNRGLFQSLAEPNLVAESGKEASFLAGGEFPIPVAQGSAANMAVSVQFKEFGIRLNFTPTVNGDRVHLKVRPEVSTLDYGNAVVLNGFRIPALSTRRAETELELRNGQTFAVAGLINNQMQSTLQKVPGIGDIPILGHLFRSRAAQKDQTELVVMITPEILASDSPGVTTDLPRYPETFLPPVSERDARPAPPAAFSSGSRSQAAAPAAAPAEVNRADGRPEAPAEALRVVEPAEVPVPEAPQAAVPPLSEAGAQGPAAPPVFTQLTEAEAREQAKEQRRLEKLASEQAERDAKAAEKARKEEAKQAERARKEEAKRAEAARKEAEKLAKEQAKRDAQAAKEQAKRDAQAAKEQAKRDAEAARDQANRDAQGTQAKTEADQQARDEAARLALDAKRQAEIQQERDRAIESAAERLRQAEAEYQAELARRSARD